MTTIGLANAVIRQTRCSRTAGLCQAWRILNDYPESLREAALALASGERADADINGFTLGDVKELTGREGYEALELLYIISRDCEEGVDLMTRLCGRDGR